MYLTCNYIQTLSDIKQRCTTVAQLQRCTPPIVLWPYKITGNFHQQNINYSYSLFNKSTKQSNNKYVSLPNLFSNTKLDKVWTLESSYKSAGIFNIDSQISVECYEQQWLYNIILRYTSIEFPTKIADYVQLSDNKPSYTYNVTSYVIDAIVLRGWIWFFMWHKYTIAQIL